MKVLLAYQQNGATLLEVTLALALAALTLGVVVKCMSFLTAAAHSSGVDEERESIKLDLIADVDCRRTLPQGICSDNQGVNVFDDDGQVILGVHGSRIGKFVVQAVCNATGDGLIIRGARMRAGASLSSGNSADFLPDPLTGRRGVEHFFPDGVELCPGGRYAPAPAAIRCRREAFSPWREAPGGPPVAFGPGFNNAPGWLREVPRFSSDECGGNVPDANYLGMIPAMNMCGVTESFMLTGPSNTEAPGFYWWWQREGTCSRPGFSSALELYFLRWNGFL